MVWALITSKGKNPLVFLEKGVKMNAQVYCDQVLQDVVLPWAKNHFGENQWTFQQDSAPAHKVKITKEFHRVHFLDF